MELLKAYWPWILIILVVIAGLAIHALEYVDATTSMLPGGEGAGG